MSKPARAERGATRAIPAAGPCMMDQKGVVRRKRLFSASVRSVRVKAVGELGSAGRRPCQEAWTRTGGVAVVHWTISQALSFLGFSLAGPNGVRGITSAICGERGVPDFGSRNCKLFHSAPLTTDSQQHPSSPLFLSKHLTIVFGTTILSGKLEFPIQVTSVGASESGEH